jgi:predicted ester cyclase
VHDNPAIVRRWFDEVWKPGGEATVDQLMARDGVGWLEGRVVNGPNEFKDARRQMLSALRDLVVSIDDLVDQGNKVVVRWNARAVHGGGGFGIAPTNMPVSFRGITWIELKDGMIVRGWDSWNLGGLLQTLSQAQPTGVRER